MPDNSLTYLANAINYCSIETIKVEDESDGDISDIDTDLSDQEVEHRTKELSSLNFLIESNVQRNNRYKAKNYCGYYNISTAIVFIYDGKNVRDFIHIKNKLLIWCGLLSKKKLYVNDVLYLADKQKAKNTYIFLVLEEKDSGYTYKYIANLSTKKIIPSYKSIIFSKIQIS
jgi:hypothetical protein